MRSKEDGMGGACSTRGRCHMGDVVVGGRKLIKWIFKKWELTLWTEVIWIRIGSSVELF
jgi:hypothetical protein